MYRCIGVQVYGCAGVQVYGCTGMYKCTSEYCYFYFKMQKKDMISKHLLHLFFFLKMMLTYHISHKTFFSTALYVPGRSGVKVHRTPLLKNM